MAAHRRVSTALVLALTVLLGFPGWSGAEDGEWIHFKTTGGVPGQDIPVDIYLDVVVPTENLDLVFEFDATVLGHPEILRGRDFPPERRTVFVIGRAYGLPCGSGDMVPCPSLAIGATDHLPFPEGEKVHVGTLVFRARWDAEPGETAVLVHRASTYGCDRTVRALDCHSRDMTYSPPRRVSIPILEQDGPRPPWDVTCSQDFRSIVVAWSNTDTYDGIRITRNGQVVSEPAGDVTTWEDQEPPVGELEYRVFSLSGGRSSYGVLCAVTFEGPVLRPPEDLRAEDLGSSVKLSWRCPVSYDEIIVFRNRAFLAELPGDARSFEDTAPPDDVSIYAVAGVREGVESEATFTLIRSAYPYRYRIPEIVVEPGRRNVRVPIIATIRDAIQALEFSVWVDTDVLEPVAFEHREELLDRFGQHLSPHGIHGIEPGRAVFVAGVNFIVGWNDVPSLYEETVAWLVFNVRDDVGPGTRTTVLFADSSTGPGVIVSNEVLIREVGQLTATPIEVLLHGEVLIDDVRSPQGTTANLAECSAGEGGSVAIHWTLTGPADEVILERDGTVIGVVDGADLSYEDPDPGYGPHVYRVIPLQGAEGFPASCEVFVGGLERFVRGDADGNGRLGLADVMAILFFVFVPGSLDLPCLDAADTDDSGEIDLEDAVGLFLGIFDTRGPRLPVVPVHDRTEDGLGCLRPYDLSGVPGH